MIGGSAWIDLAGLPRASFDALFARGPDVVVAGASPRAAGSVPATAITR